MTAAHEPVEPHIISVTRALERILGGFSEEDLGSVTETRERPAQKCIEVQYRTTFDSISAYLVCRDELTAKLSLNKTDSPQSGVSRWQRAIDAPFNILLNFETEGRVRLAIRGQTPDGILTLRDGQTVPTFPQIADITFYFIPTAPATVRQRSYFTRFEPMVGLDGVMYAGLPMVLCQQVEFIHNSNKLGELPEKIVKRMGLCFALFNRLNPTDQSSIRELIVRFDYAAAFEILLAQGTVGGSARKTHRSHRSRRKDRKDRKDRKGQRVRRNTRGRKRRP
jgi:hypothetical protein